MLSSKYGQLPWFFLPLHAFLLSLSLSLSSLSLSHSLLSFIPGWNLGSCATRSVQSDKNCQHPKSSNNYWAETLHLLHSTSPPPIFYPPLRLSLRLCVLSAEGPLFHPPCQCSAQCTCFLVIRFLCESSWAKTLVYRLFVTRRQHVYEISFCREIGSLLTEKFALDTVSRVRSVFR